VKADGCFSRNRERACVCEELVVVVVLSMERGDDTYPLPSSRAQVMPPAP
jgi:hypothetical protein